MHLAGGLGGVVGRGKGSEGEGGEMEWKNEVARELVVL